MSQMKAEHSITKPNPEGSSSDSDLEDWEIVPQASKEAASTRGKKAAPESAESPETPEAPEKSPQAPSVPIKPHRSRSGDEESDDDRTWSYDHRTDRITFHPHPKPKILFLGAKSSKLFADEVKLSHHDHITVYHPLTKEELGGRVLDSLRRHLRRLNFEMWEGDLVEERLARFESTVVLGQVIGEMKDFVYWAEIDEIFDEFEKMQDWAASSDALK